MRLLRPLATPGRRCARTIFGSTMNCINTVPAAENHPAQQPFTLPAETGSAWRLKDTGFEQTEHSKNDLLQIHIVMIGL
jgi:hypothetical protein